LGESTPADAALREAAARLPALLRERIARLAFHEALEEVWKIVRAANAYIDHQAPWALRKTDLVRMNTVLRVLADTLRVIATVLQPFMPASMARLLDQLGVPEDARDLAALAEALPAGAPLPPPSGIFPRFVEPAG
jgi:methionyl-tRNA synthetase